MVRNYRVRRLHEDDNSQEINLSLLKSDFRRLLNLQTRLDVAIEDAQEVKYNPRYKESLIEKAEDYADDIKRILSKYLGTEVLRNCVTYMLNGKDIKNIPVDIESEVYNDEDDEDDEDDDYDKDEKSLTVEDLDDFIDEIDFYLSKHDGFKNGFYG